MAIEGVILDVDGTLVDSNAAHVAAWTEALRSEGFDVAPERVRGLIGMGGDNLIPELTGLDAESEDGQRLSERHGELFRARRPQLRALPGAHDLVAALRERGLRVVVATSSKPEDLEPLLRIAGVSDLLPRRTSAGDVASSKPAPDVVHGALQRLGLPPERARMVGDSPWDVEAARRAGVATVALRSGGFSDAELAGALAIYDDPADLLAKLEESPLVTE